MNWMRFSIDKVVLMFIISVASAGLVQFYGAKYTEQLSGYSFEKYVNNERLVKAIKIESDAGVANTDYYLMSKLPAGDSSEFNICQKIKNQPAGKEIKKANGYLPTPPKAVNSGTI